MILRIVASAIAVAIVSSFITHCDMRWYLDAQSS